MASDGLKEGNGEEVEKEISTDKHSDKEEETSEIIEWEEDTGEEEEDRLTLGLVGKVWTNRTINEKAFISTLKSFFHWRDKHRIVEEQPWHFDRHAILLGEIHHAIKPTDVQLFELPMWVRVYIYHSKLDSGSAMGIDKSIRMRVRVDVRKHLLTVVKVKMRGGVEESFEIKYESHPYSASFVAS
ncbi:Kynurenine 3-monooxygenase [Bienertia sinuspersici]